MSLVLKQIGDDWMVISEGGNVQGEYVHRALPVCLNSN